MRPARAVQICPEGSHGDSSAAGAHPAAGGTFRIWASMRCSGSSQRLAQGNGLPETISPDLMISAWEPETRIEPMTDALRVPLLRTLCSSAKTEVAVMRRPPNYLLSQALVQPSKANRRLHGGPSPHSDPLGRAQQRAAFSLPDPLLRICGRAPAGHYQPQRADRQPPQEPLVAVRQVRLFGQNAQYLRRPPAALAARAYRRLLQETSACEFV